MGKVNMKDYQWFKATMLTNHCGVGNVSDSKMYNSRGNSARGVSIELKQMFYIILDLVWFKVHGNKLWMPFVISEETSKRMIKS